MMNVHDFVLSVMPLKSERIIISLTFYDYLMLWKAYNFAMIIGVKKK